MKRLRFFKAAVEVIKYSRNEPIIKGNPHKPGEKLYKFGGLTAEKEVFFVQKVNTEETIEMIVKLAGIARKEGFLV